MMNNRCFCCHISIWNQTTITRYSSSKRNCILVIGKDRQFSARFVIDQWDEFFLAQKEKRTASQMSADKRKEICEMNTQSFIIENIVHANFWFWCIRMNVSHRIGSLFCFIWRTRKDEDKVQNDWNRLHFSLSLSFELKIHNDCQVRSSSGRPSMPRRMNQQRSMIVSLIITSNKAGICRSEM